MLKVTRVSPNDLIIHPNDIFNTLPANCICEYKNWLKDRGIILDDDVLSWAVKNNAIVSTVPINTRFGVTTLNNIASGHKLLILVDLAVKQNKPFTFLSGVIGRKLYVDVIKLAKSSDVITLYVPDNVGIPFDVYKFKDDVIFI